MKTKWVTAMGCVLMMSLPSLAGVFLEPVGNSDRIYRGRAPKPNEIRKLVRTGITTVVIFKNQTNTEVDDEISGLLRAGFSADKIHHIPLPWKDLPSEKAACRQAVQALRVISQVAASTEDKVFFHCTVGEDRTGLLAGLTAQLMFQESTRLSYQVQMCAQGYGSGNTDKPAHVSEAVEESLTPLYIKMSQLIQTGRLSVQNLDEKACDEMPEGHPETNLQVCSEVNSMRAQQRRR